MSWMMDRWDCWKFTLFNLDNYLKMICSCKVYITSTTTWLMEDCEVLVSNYLGSKTIKASQIEPVISSNNLSN